MLLHFEPSQDALSLRSDVISSIKILSLDTRNPWMAKRLDWWVLKHLPVVIQIVLALVSVYPDRVHTRFVLTSVRGCNVGRPKAFFRFADFVLFRLSYFVLFRFAATDDTT